MTYGTKLPLKRLLGVSVALTGLLMTSAARAQYAAPAFDAYNNAYLVQKGGNTYYAASLKSAGTNSPSDAWIEATDIGPAIDAYEYSRTSTNRNLVIALLNSLQAQHSDWQSDGWDDDIAWVALAFARGYALTGEAEFLTQAEGGFNTAWSKGWDASQGGIYEKNSDHTVRCALSNNPFVIEGVALYKATHDSSYLTRAEQIYTYLRNNLFDTKTGQENGCQNSDGSLQKSDLVYNSGTFVTAANALYQVTGNREYYNDALLATNHVVNSTRIISSTQNTPGNQWQYWFTRGLNDFATLNSMWPTYLSWLQDNAKAAWDERSSLNVTWNDWLSKTDDTNSDAMIMSSGAAVQQDLPLSDQDLSGTYEIQNVKSGLALTVTDGSNETGAAVIQVPYTAGAHEFWKFVATSGGYYQIVNTASGLVMNVSGTNGKAGMNGTPVIQWTKQSVFPGNDQWLPVKNPDGSYSFYSLYSSQALEVPNNSTSSLTQLDQWFSNGGTNQEFTLTAR